MKTYFLLILLLGYNTFHVCKEAPKQNSIDRSLLHRLYESSSKLLPDEQSPGKKYTFSGKIVLPKGEKNAPRVYYKGAIIPTHEASILFSQTKKPAQMTLVCALPPAPTKNTIDQVIIPQGTSYKVYFLQRVSAPNGKETWHITESTGTDGYTVLPEALLLLLDPNLLEKVEPLSWNTTSMTIYLPTLTIKKLEKTVYHQSILAALDWDAFHKKPAVEEKKHQENHYLRKECA